MFNKLEFTFLPEYAKYLCDNKFELLIDEHIRLLHELQLPLMEYFKQLSPDELKEGSKPSMKNYLTHIIENRLDEFIQTSINNWKQNLLPSLTKNQIVAKDISLTILIRKKVFLKYITDYTTDAATILSIIEEFDTYSAKTELLMFGCYSEIQQEEANRHLETIQRSEMNYKRAENLAHIGSWSWDTESNKLEWTDELYRIYELEPTEKITFENIQSFCHPDDKMMVEDYFQQSIKSGEPFEFYYRIITNSEKEKVLHAVGEVLRNKENKIILHGALQDVSAQKLREKLLADNQSFISKITRLTPSLITAYNIKTGKYIFINNAIKTVLGYDVEQAMNEGSDFFTRLVHPDDLPRILKQNNEALQAANEEGNRQPEQEAIGEFYYRMRHRNGEYRWFHTYGTVFDRHSENKVEHVINISIDVTEEYELRLALEEENSFAEMLIEHSPDMLVVLDKQLNIVTWNRKAEEHNNIQRADAIGKNFYHLFPQYDNDRWKKNLERALLGETIHHPKFQFIVNGGYGEIFVIPLRNTKHETTGILTITRDITELVTTAERLQESYRELERREDRHHRMINEVQDYAIILLDKEGRIETWNAGAEKIKGYKANEIIGKSFTIFYPQKDKESRLPQQLLQHAINEGRVTHEGRRMRKDGTAFWGSVVITALHDDNGEIVGFSKVTRDLTERKRAEDSLRNYTEQLELTNGELLISNQKLQNAREQLAKNRTRYLIEAMPHIVATASGEGVLDYANQHLMNYLGLSFKEVQEGKWFDAVHPADKRIFVSTWKKSLERKENLQVEFRFKRSDGEYLWHLAIAKPLTRKQEEDLDTWIITLTNIHAQKLMDEKKDQFIGIASHELKTPLTSAKAYAQILYTLLKKEDNKAALVYVAKTNQFIDRLNKLISELLDITKIQHGKLELDVAPFDSNEMVKDTVELMQNTNPKHSISLQGKATHLIYGDRDRVQQVMINLLSNAIKYSPEAYEVEVTITNKKQSIQVAVKDHGIGIPKSDQQKIFDRFYRVENNVTKFQGLGIGLFISAEIIKQHKGSIWVESQPNKGSTFYFTLPFTK